jgi:hypothetical protein
MGYDKTSGGIAREVPCGQAYVTELAKAQLIPFITASDGTRLYPADAVEAVRRIKAERLANRGRKRA